LAARHAVPAIYEWREFAEAGGLMSYGTSLSGASSVGGISRPSAFALGSQSALHSRTACSSDGQAIEHRQAHRLLLAGFAFDFARKITTPLSADN